MISFNLKNVSRRQAFLTHLSVSAVIFFVLSYMVFFHWYPDFYFSLDGGERAIITIFLVDVVLGPGLTLLVFKPGKKSLRFDMAVILFLQFSALSWGVYKVYTERSGLVVVYLGRGVCVPNSDSMGYAMDTIEAGPGGKQRLGILQAPSTEEASYDFTMKAFQSNQSEIYYYSNQVKPLDASTVSDLDPYELHRSSLEKTDAAGLALVDSYIAHHPGNGESYRLIPLTCRYDNTLAVYDLQQMRVSELLDINVKLFTKKVTDDSRFIPAYSVDGDKS